MLIAAHIFPLDKSQLFERKFYFSPANGVLLTRELENQYDLHMWYFDTNGAVFVLFNGWEHKEVIRSVNLATGDNAPSAELINAHNRMAVEEAKHNCPKCWKYIGTVNIENHQSHSCEMIYSASGDEDENDHESTANDEEYDSAI